jgi:hypothetical protein
MNELAREFLTILELEKELLRKVGLSMCLDFQKLA